VLEVAQTTSSLRLDSVQFDYPGATYAPSCIPQMATAWAPARWCNLLKCWIRFYSYPVDTSTDSHYIHQPVITASLVSSCL